VDHAISSSQAANQRLAISDSRHNGVASTQKKSGAFEAAPQVSGCRKMPQPKIV
jgi:hypothetical protein